nr:Trk2 [Starmerella bombicola]
MGIERVRTQGSRLGVLNLDDYEFDPGLAGVFQRLRVSSTNACIRVYRSITSFFTSFLGLHYIYVISWSFVVSWILYPEHNMTYTDALFQAVSAASITGLNSVDINELKLYQQITLFIAPILTHPLTVASFMVFYRLYLYRKKFDDIEVTSKFQSRLRRAATESRFETTRKGAFGRDQTQTPQAINLQLKKRSPSPLTSFNSQEHNQKSAGRVLKETDDADSSSMGAANDERVSTFNSGSNTPAQSPNSASTPELEGAKNHEDDDALDGPSKIRFGALPRPPSRERQHDPQEMFRSLNIMRSQNLKNEMDEDDGPALVIKSPRDIERDELRGIHSAVASSYNPDTQSMSPDNHQNHSYNHPPRRLSTGALSDLGRPQRTLTRADTLMSMASNRNPRSMTANYLSWTPTVGKNSAFIGLSREQKEELGGVEYRSLKMLRWILISYFLIFLCLGWLFLIPWSYKQRYYEQIIRSYGVSPVLFGITTTLSAFNNSGLCVLPSSLSDFWRSAYVPLVVSFTVMAGNVAIPIILRFSVYIVFRMSPRFGQTRETLGFLLDHPRRCFMLLFPSTTTWWLSLTILIFIVVEVALFMILDHGTHSPQADMSAGLRLLSAYFQSIAVRTVGFTMINIGGQAPGMLVLNIVMMYIAIYPVAMSIRKSNVYEEQTLGHYYTTSGRSSGEDKLNPDARSIHSNAIQEDDEDGTSGDSSTNQGFLQRIRRFSHLNASDRRESEILNGNNNIALETDSEEDEEDDRPSTLVDHMRRQLSMDVWSLILGLMLISITESGRITRGEFSMFAVVFEVVSAHGTIGWSMGLPNTTVSLSGGFSNLGKLVMMAIMIRGRHRAMPYNVDRAVILRGADLLRRDRRQENRTRDARVMMHREPSQSGQWFPRVATTASKLTSGGTLRRMSSVSR